MSRFVRHLNVDVPEKADIVAGTPNAASAELISALDESGIETVFDRFEAQAPQCSSGLRGTCCRMCLWGPCRISERSPRGICGRDMEQVVIANVLRALASGMAAHARHAHEVILAVLAAAGGAAGMPLAGADRGLELARRLGIEVDGRATREVIGEVARVLLDDVGRLSAEPMSTLRAFAPPDRVRVWERLGILPRSASYETLESLHVTTLGSCSDWTAMARQELRSALAYCYGGLYPSSLATEILLGVPQPRNTTVGYGVLKPDHVNILMHGHSPVMAEKVLEKIASAEIQDLAREAGAEGIVVAGMCCTGDELLARHGVPTVTNIMGQELALGTGAIDAVVADMQCVIPGLKIVADCFGTRIITTCSSNRIPGAEHVPFDPEHPEDFDADATRVARLAVEAFAARDRSRIRIPESTAPASGGWSFEAILEATGGAGKIAQAVQDGRLRGIATIVGCNTPKVVYEASHVEIARRLIENGVLLTTTGCCSHALLNAGLCSQEAAASASPGLREFCTEHGLPPVLVVGGCVDNVRSLRLFTAVAEAAGHDMADMPFLFIGAEPGNEKAIGQGATFLVHGVCNLVGFPAQIPVAIPAAKPGAGSDELDDGRNSIVEFFGGDGLLGEVGAKIYTEPDPRLAAQLARMHFRRKRLALGWAWPASGSGPAASTAGTGASRTAFEHGGSDVEAV